MITIGIYDQLDLRLSTYTQLLNSVDFVTIQFSTDKEKVLLDQLRNQPTDILILLSTKTDPAFKEIALKCLKLNCKTIAITTEISRWLISNMQTLGIRGYLVMGTKASNLMDAIQDVHQGKYYCCREVSSAMLSMKNETAETFSLREKEIIRLLIDDKSSKEIAQELHLSQHTISSHRKSILRKFKVHSTTGMVKKAIDLGIA